MKDFAADGRRSHNRARRQILQRFRYRRDEGVANIFAGQNAADLKPARQDGLHVLHGMDGNVDGIVEKLLFKFLREQALAADCGQSPVEDLIAGCLDDDNLEGDLVTVDGREPVTSFVCLRESESAPPGANANLPCVCEIFHGCVHLGCTGAPPLTG